MTPHRTFTCHRCGTAHQGGGGGTITTPEAKGTPTRWICPRCVESFRRWWYATTDGATRAHPEPPTPCPHTLWREDGLEYVCVLADGHGGWHRASGLTCGWPTGYAGAGVLHPAPAWRDGDLDAVRVEDRVAP